MKLTKNMASVVEEIVSRTPNEISEMSIEELERHVRVVRKRNRMFFKFFSIPIFVKKRKSFSEIMPRGSMIVAHHRFSFREETNRKIMKIR